MSTLIISLDRVRELAGIQKEVENYKLEGALKRAHLAFRDRIGKTCYAELIAAITADPTLADGANAHWLALMDNGLPEYLAFLTDQIALPKQHSEAQRRGFYTNSGTESQSVDQSDMGAHSKHREGMFQAFEKQLLEYILDNREDYTCLDSGCDIDLENQFPGGIVTTRSNYSYYGDETTLDPDRCNG